MTSSFGIPDPFSRFDSAMSRIGGSSDSATPEYRKPFSPDDYKPFKQKMLDYGGTGLRGIFDTLSFAGDHLRGTLAGDPMSRVSGRELLDKYHVTDKNDKGWGSWAAGLAADVATDPLTYMGLGPTTGAMSKLGKAVSKTSGLEGWGRKAALEGFHATESGLKAAGRSADEIAHLSRGGVLPGINETPWRVATAAQEEGVQKLLGRGIDPGERLGGMIGFGLPYGPKMTISGGAPGRTLAGAMDKVGDKLKFGNPLGRFGNYLFDNDVRGTLDEASQRGYATRGAAAARKAAAEGRGAQYEAVHGLEPLLRDPSMKGREVDLLNMARDIGEGSPLSLKDPALRAQVSATGVPENLVGGYRGQHIEQRLAGLPADEWKNADNLNYMRRKSIWGEMEKPTESKPYPIMSAHDLHREPVFNQAGGTGRLQDWSLRFSGQKPEFQTEKSIFKDLVRDHIDRQAMQGVRAPLTKDQLYAFKGQSEEIAKLYGEFSPQHVSQQVPLYTPDIIGNVGDYAYQHGRKMGSAQAAVGALAHLADTPESLLAKGKQFLSMREAVRKLGFRSYNPDEALGITGQHGFGPELLKALAPKGAPMAEPLLRGVGMGGVNNALDRFAIDAAHLPELIKSQAKQQAAEGLKAPLGWYDSVSNAFKALAYPIWPASHTKNAVTAAINNLRTDTPFGAARSLAEQIGMLRTPGVGDAALNAERKSQFQHAGILGGMDSSAEMAGMNLPTRIQSGDRITMALPGSDRAGPTGNLVSDIARMIGKEGVGDTLANTGKAALGVAKRPWSPSQWKQSIGENLGIKGVFGQAADTLPAVKAGRIASTNVEDAFRGAQYRGLARQGYAPEQAAKLVNETHFDYGDLTDFEKTFMRRAMPFYTFASRNIPLQARTLASKPGIAMGQIAPAMQGRHQGEYVPDYMAGNVSIPLGETEPGKARYISTFGLPIEEAFSKFNTKGGMPDLRSTALGFMGNLNPMIKGPLESLFDTQFYSGRKLSDLQAPTSAKLMGRMFGEENPQMLAQAMANTPFTRFFTSFDRAIDPRKPLWAKALNLATGAKISDVDVDKQKAIEMRNALDSMLGQQPHLSPYTNWYVKPDQAQNMTPQEIEDMRALTTMHRDAHDYVQRRRLSEKMQGLSQ